MTKAIKIVAIISGNGGNLQSIIDAIESDQLNAQINLVISNNANAYGLSRASKHGIKTQVIDHRDYLSRNEFDRALRTAVDQYEPDYIVLAGFMRVLGVDFVQSYAGRILNIHPSILPAYKGLNTHQRALDQGETEHGVSIHIVTGDLDDGPILLRGRYPIEATDSASDLQQKGHKLEHEMYPEILRWLAEGWLQVNLTSIQYKDKALLEPIEFEYA